MSLSFWTYVPISEELLRDNESLAAAVEKNWRESSNAKLFNEARHADAISMIERGTWVWDMPLFDNECEGGCCECCDEHHAPTWRDVVQK